MILFENLVNSEGYKTEMKQAEYGGVVLADKAGELLFRNEAVNEFSKEGMIAYE